VELILIACAGHQWPGSAGSGARGADTVSTALNATAVIWGFFAQHPHN
jgi:poly(3-hydroxybutyrate) depolymerase